MGVLTPLEHLFPPPSSTHGCFSPPGTRVTSLPGVGRGVKGGRFQSDSAIPIQTRLSQILSRAPSTTLGVPPQTQGKPLFLHPFISPKLSPGSSCPQRAPMHRSALFSAWEGGAGPSETGAPQNLPHPQSPFSPECSMIPLSMSLASPMPRRDPAGNSGDTTRPQAPNQAAPIGVPHTAPSKSLMSTRACRDGGGERRGCLLCLLVNKGCGQRKAGGG